MKHFRPLKKSILTAMVASTLLFAPAMAQSGNFDKVEVVATPVAGRVSMLTGRGGNIAVFAGDRYTLLVDDQYAPLTDRIVEAVKGLTTKPIRFVVNTHWHGDHTGGNENLGKRGAVIVAHDNVYKRLSTNQFIAFFDKTIKATDEVGLPVITFDDSMSFRLSGETIEVRFIGPAHTDSDSLVYFRDSNVLHTGDTYFAGRYPFIDTSTGGSAEGVLKALDTMLKLTDDKTVIIPGHGALSDRKGLEQTRKMISTVNARVVGAIDMGQTDKEILSSDMTADFDAAFGGGFISGQKFLQLLCDSARGN